jgi:hypothetical protein
MAADCPLLASQVAATGNDLSCNASEQTEEFRVAACLRVLVAGLIDEHTPMKGLMK